jgi:hypothetical protein
LYPYNTTFPSHHFITSVIVLYHKLAHYPIISPGVNDFEKCARRLPVTRAVSPSAHLMLPAHPITDLYQTRPLGGVVACRRCHVERSVRTMVYMWAADRTRRAQIPTDGHAVIGVTSRRHAGSTEAGIIYTHGEGAVALHQGREMCSADMYQLLRRLWACGSSLSVTNCTIMTRLHNRNNIASALHLDLGPFRRAYRTGAVTPSTTCCEAKSVWRNVTCTSRPLMWPSYSCGSLQV